MFVKRKESLDLLEVIKGYTYYKHNKVPVVELSKDDQVKFHEQYYLMMQHNPLMELAKKYGLIYQNAQCISLCTMWAGNTYGKWEMPMQRRIMYMTPRITMRKIYLKYYYPPFFSRLFINDKLEEYVAEYSRRTKFHETNVQERKGGNTCVSESPKKKLNTSIQDSGCVTDVEAVWCNSVYWWEIRRGWDKIFENEMCNVPIYVPETGTAPGSEFIGGQYEPVKPVSTRILSKKFLPL